MKTLNVLDLAFQTFVIACIVIPCIIVAASGNLETTLGIAIYGAMFLGPWQMVSSLITTLSRGLYLRQRVIHLISATVYLAGIALAASVGSEIMDFEGVPGIIGGAIAFLTPAVLAVFYYIITWKTFQLARAASRSAASVSLGTSKAS